jgi:citrate lyase beta subunit
MIRKLSPIQLGGSLYIPATHKNVNDICNANKYPNLRSCIIDTEDAIGEDDLESALDNISKMLEDYEPKDLIVFIRPRNPEVLQAILKINNIEKIDGFSLPKFSTEVMRQYAQIISMSGYNFHLMPVLESLDIFSREKLEEIRLFLLNSSLSILSLRLGGEDMMQYLGLKRRCEDNIYQLAAPSKVIADVLNTFKPFGFNVSATVFNCIDKHELYSKNVEEDLRQGLIGKTIIHPNQIDPINKAYKVTEKEYDMAMKMLNKNTEAIIVQDGQMGEKFAHTSWAKVILQRYEFYGLKIES